MNLTDDIAVNKLLGMTVFYKTMQEFMDAVYLGVESDLKRCGGRQYTADCVTLMTLHGSKGLEFPVTIIYGVRKGAIPFERDFRQIKENSTIKREKTASSRRKKTAPIKRKKTARKNRRPSLPTLRKSAGSFMWE